MSRPRQFAAAFTLIEVLVSLVILSFVVLVTAQLVNSTSALTLATGKRTDTDTQSRSLFDLMAIDFGKIVMRSDVDYYLQKNTGNDQMAFYSEAPGYNPQDVTNPQAGVSLVGYRVNSSYQLERLGKALICSDASNSSINSFNSMLFSPTPGTLISHWSGIVDGSDANYQVVADLVYRLEFNFLLKSYIDPSGTTQPAILSVTPWDTRQAHTVVNGLSDVSAIMVAVALLDNASRKIVQQDQYATMVNALPDAGDSTSILQTWEKNDGFLTSSGIPHNAAANIRLYQRTFYLGANP